MSTLTLTRGDDYAGDRRLVITVVDADDAPLDLTGMDLTFAVYASGGSTTAEISKTTDSGIALASPQSGDTLGLAYITIDSADTASLVPGRMRKWELEAEDGDGKVTLARGVFVLEADSITA